MNIFKVHQGYRLIGPNYGLPVFYVDCGPGLNWEPLKIMEKLVNMKMNSSSWVVIRNNSIREKGTGVLVSGLKTIHVKVEMEVGSDERTPGWFMEADRWIAYWSPTGTFNYGSLRTRQDMAVYNGQDIVKFLDETKKLPCYKGLVVKDKDTVFDTIKFSEVKVYGDPGRDL